MQMGCGRKAAMRLKKEAPESSFGIKITKLQSNTSRTFQLTSNGQRWGHAVPVCRNTLNFQIKIFPFVNSSYPLSICHLTVRGFFSILREKNNNNKALSITSQTENYLLSHCSQSCQASIKEGTHNTINLASVSAWLCAKPCVPSSRL
jgi:hypothetical protein